MSTRVQKDNALRIVENNRCSNIQSYSLKSYKFIQNTAGSKNFFELNQETPSEIRLLKLYQSISMYRINH